MNNLTYNALRELYPTVISCIGDVAYDANGAEVSYDLEAVNAKVEADKQAQESHKNSALAKLTALGLTENEVKALLGTT
jgi:hypothetical protein